MSIKIAETVCVNCNLYTPKANSYCVHCGKNRAIKLPVVIRARSPIPISYARILRKQGGDLPPAA